MPSETEKLRVLDDNQPFAACAFLPAGHIIAAGAGLVEYEVRSQVVSLRRTDLPPSHRACTRYKLPPECLRRPICDFPRLLVLLRGGPQAV